MMMPKAWLRKCKRARWAALATLAFAAAGCGVERRPAPTTPSKAAEQPAGKGVACEGSGYLPIPLVREGLVPLRSVEELPFGEYAYEHVEMHVREASEPPAFQAHFSETMMERAPMLRKICGNPPSRSFIFETEFPAVPAFARNRAGAWSFFPSAYRLYAENNIFRLQRMPPGPERAESLGAYLQEWSEVRIYRLDATSYELRLFGYGPEGPYFAMKRMLLRFRFTPWPTSP